MVNILTIKAFDDNYIWLIKDSQSAHCIVIDPGDAHPVLEVLEAQQLMAIYQWSLSIQIHTHGMNLHALRYAATSTAMEPLIFFIMVMVRWLPRCQTARDSITSHK